MAICHADYTVLKDPCYHVNVKGWWVVGVVALLSTCGCGGQGSNGNGLQVSSVANSYHGPYTTAAGGSGSFTLTIGPTGAVNANLLNSSGAVTGTISGTLSNGGGFVGYSQLDLIVNGAATSDNYTDTGTFVEESGGGLQATLVSKLVTGTVPGTTTNLTLSFG